MGMTSAEVVERHRAAGKEFVAGGVRSFVREAGEGEAVVCVHGVPSSSFLYRKVLDELAAAAPERIRSLTVLNTVVDVEGFKRPWSMEPFARRGIGEVYLATLTKPAFRRLMALQGIANMAAVPKEEIDAYVDLLKREDRGRHFLRIMRGFERTAEKAALYRGALRDVPYPVQIVWGAEDPALKLAVHGEQARRAAGLEEIHTVPAKHFLQEDQAPAVAERVAALAQG